MRSQQVVVAALFAAALCFVATNAIPRPKSEALDPFWSKLSRMPKEQIKVRVQALLEKTMRNALDDKIIGIIEACVKNPALDPIEIPYINIAIHEDFANFSGHMDTVSLDGISTLTVDNFHLGLLLMKLEFALSLPTLALRGNYDLDGVFAGLLPIYGKGPFTLSITNFTLNGVINARLVGGSTITIKEMQIELDLDTFLFDFKYLLGNEELSDVVNEMINDMGMAFLTKYKLSIQDAIERTLTTAVNGAGITIGDITGGGGGGEGPSFCSAA